MWPVEVFFGLGWTIYGKFPLLCLYCNACITIAMRPKFVICIVLGLLFFLYRAVSYAQDWSDWVYFAASSVVCANKENEDQVKMLLRIDTPYYYEITNECRLILKFNNKYFTVLKGVVNKKEKIKPPRYDEHSSWSDFQERAFVQFVIDESAIRALSSDTITKAWISTSKGWLKIRRLNKDFREEFVNSLSSTAFSTGR